MEDLFSWNGGGHRLTLELPNSYTVDDGLNVTVFTDDVGSQSAAKAQVPGELYIYIYIDIDIYIEIYRYIDI